MAASYSANQYDNAFQATRLKSWEVPKNPTSVRPGSKTRCKTIADSNGRLLPGYKRENSHLTGYVGTWDLPKQLPGNNIHNPTARERSAYLKLQREYENSVAKINNRYQPTSRSMVPHCDQSGQLDKYEDNEFLEDEMGEDPSFSPVLSERAPSQRESVRGTPQNVGHSDLELSNKIPEPDFSNEFDDDVLAGL